MIESPGEEGVGRGLICVAVGCGEAVASAVEDWPAELQAVEMNSPMMRIPEVVFIAVLETIHF